MVAAATAAVESSPSASCFATDAAADDLPVHSLRHLPCLLWRYLTIGIEEKRGILRIEKTSTGKGPYRRAAKAFQKRGERKGGFGWMMDGWMDGWRMCRGIGDRVRGGILLSPGRRFSLRRPFRISGVYRTR